MNTHPHLFKRGDTYQWRRKTRRLSTGNIDIKLSLGTTDRHLAHILARKVSSQSDLIMEQIVGGRITPEQGRAFLSEVIRKDMASSPRRNAVLRTFKEQTGQDKLSARENIQVMDLYVSGKAKAWSGDETPVATAVTVPHTEPSSPEPPDPALNAIVTRMNALKALKKRHFAST